MVETYMPKKTPNTFYKDRWWKLFYYLNFGSINLNTFLQNSMTQTYPLFHLKWHVSQLSTRLHSSHRFSTLGSCIRLHMTEKTFINTSFFSSTIYENIEIIHLWKVIGALHNPNGILLKENVPYGQR